MTPKQFIIRAIEGGWNDKDYRTPCYAPDAVNWTHYD